MAQHGGVLETISPIEIRAATGADIPAILAITEEIQALHAEAYPSVFKRVAPGTLALAALQGVLVDPAQRVLVGLVDGIVAGYARAEFQDRPESPIKHARRHFYLHELGVRQGQQRHGVGMALIGELRLVATSLGCTDILVDVMEGNLTAQAFYAATGFTAQRLVMRQTLT